MSRNKREGYYTGCFYNKHVRCKNKFVERYYFRREDGKQILRGIVKFPNTILAMKVLCWRN